MDNILHRHFKPQNKEEFYRYYLAASEAQFELSNLSNTRRQSFDKVDQERLIKEIYNELTKANATASECVKELYRLRLSQYQDEYLRDGYAPTREQKIDVREQLKNELADSLLQTFDGDRRSARAEVGALLRERGSNDKSFTRRIFVGGIGALALAIIAQKSLSEKGSPEPEPEPSLVEPKTETEYSNNEGETSSSVNKEAIEKIKSNPELLRDYGFSDAVCENLKTYVDLGGDDENMAEYISRRIISEKMIMATSKAYFDSSTYTPEFDSSTYTPEFDFYEPKVTNNSFEGEISVTHHGHDNRETLDYYEFSSSSKETENAVNTMQALFSGLPNEALDNSLLFATENLEMTFDGYSFKVIEKRKYYEDSDKSNDIDR